MSLERGDRRWLETQEEGKSYLLAFTSRFQSPPPPYLMKWALDLTIE